MAAPVKGQRNKRGCLPLLLLSRSRQFFTSALFRCPDPDFCTFTRRRQIQKVTFVPLPKMPRAQKPTGKSRHDPLHVQLDGDEVEAKYGRVSKPGKRRKSNKAEADDGDDDEVQHYLYLRCLFSLFSR